MNGLLSAALSYAERGWCVLPTHSIRADDTCSCGGVAGCKPGKHPRIRDWINKATSDPEQIRKWWRDWPNANVGILTGKRSGIVVADIDCHGDSDGLARLAEWEAEHGPLPATMSVRTGGGGRHLYFSAPGEALPNGKLPNGMGDFLAESCFALAPPSNHVSGARYEVEGQTKVLAPLPDALRPVGESARARKPVQQNAGAQRAPERLEMIPEGYRNSFIISLAGTMRQAGISNEAALSALRIENRLRCNTMLEDSELRDIAESGGKYESRGARFSNGQTVWRRDVVSELLKLAPDHVKLFFYLVTNAAYRDEEGVDRVKAGEVVESYQSIAKSLRWEYRNQLQKIDHNKVRRWVLSLQDRGFLVVVKGARSGVRTRIRIKDYVQYQGYLAFPNWGSEQLRTVSEREVRTEAGQATDGGITERPANSPREVRTELEGVLRTEDQVCVFMGGEGLNPDDDPTASILGEAR